MKTNKLALISVLFSFFCMGFVDLVGIASNYVKEDLHLTDTVANVLPSLVFIWFLIFSVPTGVLMNRIGRKNTVLLSLIVTALALFLPLCGNTLTVMLCAFSLLGIGNALMQTSLNPLVTCVIRNNNVASTLTFGQFIKAIASFIAPYIAMWGATAAIPTLGYDWRILFAIFLIISILATAILSATQIEEPVTDSAATTVTAQFAGAFRLLSPRGNQAGAIILLSFIGIMCHVGIDVGTNTTAPKILIERLGMNLNQAAFATSLYFIFRTIGCLTGTIFLRLLKVRTFFIISVICMTLSMLSMYIGQDQWILYAGIALVGYGNSNIFSMCFANAIQALPCKQNEVSGLMIMGLFGGAIFPLAMGLASDMMGQGGAVLCMSIGVAYLATYIPTFSLSESRESLLTLPSAEKVG